MRIYLSALAGVAAAALATSPALAGVTFYTDQTAFLAALNSSTVEDFGDTTLASGLSYTSTVGIIDSGRFNDQLAVAGQDTTFSFAGGTNAFGGNFDLTPGGAGIGIAFTLVPGGLLTQELDRAYNGGFFGFISTDLFTSVTLSGGTQAIGVETYNLDNLTFGTASPAPEPASWAMMLGGFGAIGGAMRARRKVAVAFG